MEKDIKLGTVGGVELKFEGGKAVVAITASESVLDGGAVIQGSASASVDASILIDKIFAAIEARSPAGTVMIEEAVKIIVKNAVLAIK